MNLAPVILFVYNRPDHTSRCLNALALNKYASATELIIYADGPRPGAKKEELHHIELVRKLIQSEKRFKQTTINISEKNKGLANSIIDGVTETVNKYGSVIVLEDDLICAEHFLSFMNRALSLYGNNDQVACISGYIYPVKVPLPDLFFLKGADCWGWATWKRSWDLFEKDGAKLLAQIRAQNLSGDFNFNDSYPYTKMLEDQINGKNKSWAIRWYAAAYLAGKLTLYPGKSLINNIGFDGTGTHSGKQKILSSNFSKEELEIQQIVISENTEAKNKIAAYFRQLTDRSLKTILKNRFSSVLAKFRE